MKAPARIAGAIVAVVVVLVVSGCTASVPRDTAPAFARTVADQTYAVGTAIPALTLPAASGGNGPLTYSLRPDVPGITFDHAARTLRGTPTEAGTFEMRFKAVDADANADERDAATLHFKITVTAAPSETDPPPDDADPPPDDTDPPPDDTDPPPDDTDPPPVQGSVPGPVRNLDAAGNERIGRDDPSIRLTWTAPADDGGSPITGYRYRYRPRHGNAAGAWTGYTTLGDATAVLVTLLDENATYEFEVLAVNAHGAGPATIIRISNWPPPPADVSLVHGGPDTSAFTFSWSPVTGTGTPITGYVWAFKQSSHQTWDSTPVSPTTTEVTVSGLEPRTSYDFQVRADTALRHGRYSTPITAVTRTAAAITALTPATLTTASLRANGNKATLRFTLSSGARWHATATAGHFSVSGLPGVAVESLSNRSGRSLDVTIRYDGSSLDTDTRLEFRIDPAAHDDRNSIVATIPVTATDADVLPTISVADITVAESAGSPAFTLRITPTPNQEIHLRWTMTSESGDSADGNDYAQSSAGSSRTLAANVAVHDLPMLITADALDESDETFTLTLFDLSANARFAGGGTALAARATIADDDRSAGAPTGLSAALGTNAGEVDLTWTAPADAGVLNGSAATIVEYQYRTAATAAGLGAAAWRDTDSATAAFTVTGLEVGDHHFQVRAVTGVTPHGAASGGASATVSAAAPDTSATLVVTATVASTDPAPLTKENLDGARLGVDLAGADWVASPSPGDVTVSGVAGLTVNAVVRQADPRRAVVTLGFDGTDFDRDATLGLTIAAAAHGGANAIVVPDAATVRAYAALPATAGSVPGPVRDIVAFGATWIAVWWQPPESDGGSPITGYRYRYRTGGAGEWSGYTSSGYTTTGISRRVAECRTCEGDKAYDVEVQALNTHGAGPGTIVNVSARPPAPAGASLVPASPDTSALTFSWSPVTGTALAGYFWEYRAEPENSIAGNWIPHAVSHTLPPPVAPLATTTVTVTGLDPRTRYAFRVRADTATRFGHFATVTAWTRTAATVRAVTPATLTTAAIRGNGNKATLRFTLSSGASWNATATASHFSVSGLPGVAVESLSNRSGRSIDVTIRYDGSSLDTDTRLEFRIEPAAHDDGNTIVVTIPVTATDTDVLPTISVADVTVAEGAHSPAFTLRITPTPNQDIDLRWRMRSEPADTAGVNDYVWYGFPGGTGNPETLPANGATHELRMLLNQDAIDESDETFTLTLSELSANALFEGGGATLTARATITDDDTKAGAPTGLAAAAANAGEVVLDWTAPADVGVLNGSAATIGGYQYRTATSSTGLAGARWWDTNSASLSVTVTGLAAGEHHFQVRAVTGVTDAHGAPAGAPSASASATVQTAGASEPPGVPGRIKLISIGHGSFTIWWEASTIPTGTRGTVEYDYQWKPSTAESWPTAFRTGTDRAPRIESAGRFTGQSSPSLALGEDYHFRVRACFQGSSPRNCSAWSAPHLLDTPRVLGLVVSSTPATLTEGNLDGATLRVRLSWAQWVANPAPNDVTLTGIPGLTVSAVARESHPRYAVLTLAFDGTDLDTDTTIGLTIAPAAHNGANTVTVADAATVQATVEP